MRNVVEILKAAYDAGVNVMFHGRQGIGKTAVTEQLQESGEFFVLPMILSNFDPLVLGGYPGREKEQGKETFISTFAKPQWLITAEQAKKAGKKVIIFMDEFNRADVYAHNTAMRLVNEKSINGFSMPEDTIFAACCNPETDGDPAITVMTDPMLARWMHIPVFSDAPMWLKWADEKASGVDSLMVDFIRTSPDRLMGFSEENYFKDQILKRIKPTPRTNSFAGRIINSYRDVENQLPDNLFNRDAVVLMLSGLIGMEGLQQLKTFAENSYHKPFTIDEMLKPTKKVLDKAKMLTEKGHTQVLIASLEVARDKIPDTTDMKGLKGFFKFIVLAPADVQCDFWHRKEKQTFWSQVLIADETPEEVTAVLNK